MSIFNVYKKQIIIAILIFFIIVVVGVGIYYLYLKKSSVNIDKVNTPSQKVEQQKTSQVKDNNISLPINPTSISDCDKASDLTNKNNCLQFYTIKQAAGSGDLNKCKEIKNAALTADCTAQASFILAMQKKDKKYCENIVNKTDHDYCLKVLVGLGVK